LDTDRFIELLKPHYNDALRYCWSLCSGKSEAEASDVLQQSVLQAMENQDSLKDPEKFKPWFFKIITRCYYDTFRRSFWKRFRQIEKIESSSNIPCLFDIAKMNEDRMLISQALSLISDKERTALLLFEIAGFSIEEISDIQNEKSISTVKSRLSRTRQKLRDIILTAESSTLNKKSLMNNGKIRDVETETIKIISEINTGKNGR
jgi:RNA polymerase sigma-70 factor (ECF subfamily)